MMKRSFFLLNLLILASVLALPYRRCEAENRAAQIAVSNGSVAVMTANKLGQGSEMRAGAAGSLVQAGEAVGTGPGATAKILLPDRSILDVQPGTLVVLEQMAIGTQEQRDFNFVLMYGRARVLASKRPSHRSHFFIRTKVAVMGVRGTEFVAASTAEGKFSVSVLEGEVSVSGCTGGIRNDLRPGMPPAPCPKENVVSFSLKSGERLAQTVATNWAPGSYFQAKMKPAEVAQVRAKSMIHDQSFKRKVIAEEQGHDNSIVISREAIASLSQHKTPQLDPILALLQLQGLAYSEFTRSLSVSIAGGGTAINTVVRFHP
jgi:hypothetical protein